jgi:hypothetical protein
MDPDFIPIQEIRFTDNQSESEHYSDDELVLFKLLSKVRDQQDKISPSRFNISGISWRVFAHKIYFMNETFIAIDTNYLKRFVCHIDEIDICPQNQILTKAVFIFVIKKFQKMGFSQKLRFTMQKIQFSLFAQTIPGFRQENTPKIICKIKAVLISPVRSSAIDEITFQLQEI